MTTTTDLVRAARDGIEHLDPVHAAQELADGALLVDIREPAERDEIGAIPGTVHVPRGLLEFRADPGLPSRDLGLDPERRVILYCAAGARSALAVRTLQQLGYTDVAHLDGGIQAWLADGRPVEVIG